MRIEYVTLAAGPEGVIRPGDIVDVPKKLAEQLIASGSAKAVVGRAVRQVETATTGPPENAATRVGRPETATGE